MHMRRAHVRARGHTHLRVVRHHGVAGGHIGRLSRGVPHLGVLAPGCSVDLRRVHGSLHGRALLPLRWRAVLMHLVLHLLLNVLGQLLLLL